VIRAGVAVVMTGLLVAYAGVVQAQAPDLPAARDSAVRELTLEDALAYARKRNRSLIADRARLAQAQTNIDLAWAALLPTITARGSYTRNYAEFNFCTPDPVTMMCPPGSGFLIQPINQLDAIAQFQAPLIVPAAYAGLRSVKDGFRSAEANFEVSEETVLFAVAQSFYAAEISDEVVNTRRSNIEVAKATLANAKTRFSAGTVTKVDVDRAELALVRAEQQEREAVHGRGQAYRTLATLIQIEGPFTIKRIERLAPPPPEQELGSVLELRPQYRALQLQADSEDARRKGLAWRWAPSLSGFGNARRFNYQNFNRDNYSWAVGVQLDWVIFDGGIRDAQRHAAAAAAEEARARADVFANQVRDDLVNSRSLLETKRQGVFAAMRAVELAKETINLVRTQYEAGTVTQVDLLQAQDGLILSQLSLAQARFDAAVADLTLRRASGTFPPK
jgi:outer membrane protein TolC